MEQFKKDFQDGLMIGLIHIMVMAFPLVLTMAIPTLQHFAWMIGLGL